MELAFLVHTEGDQLGLAGWTALLERARVDVTLVPPDFTESEFPQRTCYLELRLVDVRYWNTAWRDVAADLLGKPGKPRAHAAICFLLYPRSRSSGTRLTVTTNRYDEFVSRVPMSEGTFGPTLETSFDLIVGSDPQIVRWPHPIVTRWPDGFEADVRVLWVSIASGA